MNTKYIAEAYTNLLGEDIEFYLEDTKLVILTEGVKAPTEVQLLEEITKLEALEYRELRKAEYDKLNQQELLTDDLINGTSTLKEAILAIKAKYPKGDR